MQCVLACMEFVFCIGLGFGNAFLILLYSRKFIFSFQLESHKRLGIWTVGYLSLFLAFIWHFVYNVYFVYIFISYGISFTDYDWKKEI